MWEINMQPTFPKAEPANTYILDCGLFSIPSLTPSPLQCSCSSANGAPSILAAAEKAEEDEDTAGMDGEGGRPSSLSRRSWVDMALCTTCTYSPCSCSSASLFVSRLGGNDCLFLSLSCTHTHT